jgi:hypothetical protein
VGGSLSVGAPQAREAIDRTKVALEKKFLDQAVQRTLSLGAQQETLSRYDSRFGPTVKALQNRYRDQHRIDQFVAAEQQLFGSRPVDPSPVDPAPPAERGWSQLEPISQAMIRGTVLFEVEKALKQASVPLSEQNKEAVREKLLDSLKNKERKYKVLSDTAAAAPQIRQTIGEWAAPIAKREVERLYLHYDRNRDGFEPAGVRSVRGYSSRNAEAEITPAYPERESVLLKAAKAFVGFLEAGVSAHGNAYRGLR